MLEILSIILEMTPLIVLFIIFMLGYKIACMDFKPKSISKQQFSHMKNQQYDAVNSIRKSLQLHELGIDDLNQPRNVPDEFKRGVEVKNLVRSHSISSPDNTANILRAWLHEKP